jgi:hypothetical protein
VATRHAIFYVNMAQQDVVTWPNGDTREAPAHQATEVMRSWWYDHYGRQERERREALIDDWKSQLSQWVNACRVEEGKKGRVSWVTMPDGGRVTVAGGTAQDAMQAGFSRRHRRPASVEDWLDTAFRKWFGAAKVEQVVTWVAGFIEDGTESKVDLGRPVKGPCRVPAREIALYLDALADEGWKLIHVSEDRGCLPVYNANFDATPTTIRYLLQRST